MNEPRSNQQSNDNHGAEEASPGLLREFFQFLLRDSIWWLLAILIVLALVGIVIYLTADSPAPFIYRETTPQ